LLLSVSCTGFAQKVKIKNGSVLVNDTEVYKVSDEGGITTFSTVSGKEFMSVISTSYQEASAASKTAVSGRFPATRTSFVKTATFLQNGEKIYTDMSDKKLITAFYTAGVMDSEGTIDKEKLTAFVNKHNNVNLKYKLVN